MTKITKKRGAKLKNKYFEKSRLSEEEFEKIVFLFSMTMSANKIRDKLKKDNNISISRNALKSIFDKLRERIYEENNKHINSIQFEERLIRHFNERMPEKSLNDNAHAVKKQKDVKSYLWMKVLKDKIYFFDMSNSLYKNIDYIVSENKNLDLDKDNIIGLFSVIQGNDDIIFDLRHEKKVKEFRKYFQNKKKIYSKVYRKKDDENFTLFINELSFKFNNVTFRRVYRELLKNMKSTPLKTIKNRR